MTSALFRLLISFGLLGAVAIAVDLRTVWSHLSQLHPGWILAGLALCGVQILLSAWRWAYTARRLDVGLRFPVALREYLLASFLNQVLPGGILGDASRAWRHARNTPDTGAAVRAVVLERASGQIVMAIIAIPALLVLAGIAPALPAWSVAAACAAMALVGASWLPMPPTGTRTGTLADVQRALLNPVASRVQLLTSAMVVATYLLVFLAAARAVGATTPAIMLLPLVPPVLLAMLVPITVAGWGLREGAAAGVWALAGLDPAQGAAIAIAYGLIVLASTLPGAFVPKQPGRTQSNKTSSPI